LDEKEKNFGQSIWDKSVRTYWGTCWELGKPLENRKKLKTLKTKKANFMFMFQNILNLLSCVHIKECSIF
jgi:hypothetical protein